MEKQFESIHEDIGLNTMFIKGENKAVRRCWHFMSDGNDIPYLFRDNKDFVQGMNRIFFTCRRFQVTVLAFCLMDTHIHFILHGKYETCNQFAHEYIRRTVLYCANTDTGGQRPKNIPISHQPITDDLYLKRAICYVLRNPISAGLQYNFYDYPWSSGSLYFRHKGLWTTPVWMQKGTCEQCSMGVNTQKKVFRTKERLPEGTRIIAGTLIFPGEYVAYQAVESLFRTCKSFNYFMGASRDSDIEERGGIISSLSIPMNELGGIEIPFVKSFSTSTVFEGSTRQSESGWQGR